MKSSSLVLSLLAFLISSTASAQLGLRLNLGLQPSTSPATPVAPVLNTVVAPVANTVVAPVVNTVVAPVANTVVAPVANTVVAPVVNTVVPAVIEILPPAPAHEPIIAQASSAVASLIDEVSAPSGRSHEVPEMDAAAAPQALALLLGCALLLGSRRSRPRAPR